MDEPADGERPAASQPTRQASPVGRIPLHLRDLGKGNDDRLAVRRVVELERQVRLENVRRSLADERIA